MYVIATVSLTMLVRRTGEAAHGVVLAMVAADILFIFAIARVATPPEYYARSLLIGFAILHLSDFYFGRRIAWEALVAIVAAYLGMIWNFTGSGHLLGWKPELASLAVFVLVASSFIVHNGSFRERLHRIAQLANLALIDPLSGCLNRRGLEQQLKRELARAARTGRDVALLALDVDSLRNICDSCGQQAGDTVIREVGELLRSIARGGDCVARTGDGEFTLLLPETSAPGAFRLATRVREAVAQHQFEGVSALAVSVSIGLVADRVHDENILHDLHTRADEALSAAKEAGHDRVSIWTPHLRGLAAARASQQAVLAG